MFGSPDHHEGPPAESAWPAEPGTPEGTKRPGGGAVGPRVVRNGQWVRDDAPLGGQDMPTLGGVPTTLFASGTAPPPKKKSEL